MRIHIIALCMTPLIGACADDSENPRSTASGGNNLSAAGSGGSGGEDAAGSAGAAGTSAAAGNGGSSAAGDGGSAGSGGSPQLPSACYFAPDQTSCAGQTASTPVFCALGTPKPVWQPLLDDGCHIGSASNPDEIILCCPFSGP